MALISIYGMGICVHLGNNTFDVVRNYRYRVAMFHKEKRKRELFSEIMIAR